MVLERDARRADQMQTMSRPTVPNEPDAVFEIAAAGARLSSQQLAHELNSLLDGSLRCLALAHGALEAPGDETASDARASEYIVLAREALDHMATLLQRVMATAEPRVQVLDDRRPLGQVVPALVALLEPMAAYDGVSVTWNVAPEAARRPTGLLESVLINGLRNALEAAALAPAGLRRVELDVTLVEGGEQLEITIVDSGPGITHEGESPRPRRRGHGLGLPLCRQIVTQLGGTLRLLSVPNASGTVLRVRVPTGEPAAAGAEP
jgi:signal transduction histidine kinase